MISTSNISLRYGKRILFEDVNIKFTPGNCYGLIGANGAGKSTFLKILSGELEANTGQVIMDSKERLAMLKQNHYEFDDFSVINTVIMGHKKLYKVMSEKDALYAKEDFTEEDGLKASELETEFAEMDGWNAESEAGTLLGALGIKENLHHTMMKDLEGNEKVRVLLAQALFGNPDILLLDEPTNHLDITSITWLIDFLNNFKNTVIVVSHDRYFLNAVCTHMADIDFGKISVYTGNYTFWYESSQLALKQKMDSNKKLEDRRKELEDFVARFSANASKSKQATSRKKLLEKLVVEEIKPSNRRYPHIAFKPEREAGNQLLSIENLSVKDDEGLTVIENLTLLIETGEKVAFVGPNGSALTALFQALMEERKPSAGEFKWGTTTSRAYFPKDNSKYFTNDLSLVDWLRQYSKEKEETFIRGYLGRMLFSGDEALKQSNVLSGGEKVRCMLSAMMLKNANVLLMDEPTNHLDLEAITALNNGLIDFKGTLLMVSHDIEFMNTVANRVIEIGPGYVIDKKMTYQEFIDSPEINSLRESMMLPA